MELQVNQTFDLYRVTPIRKFRRHSRLHDECKSGPPCGFYWNPDVNLNRSKVFCLPDSSLCRVFFTLFPVVGVSTTHPWKLVHFVETKTSWSKVWSRESTEPVSCLRQCPTSKHKETLKVSYLRISHCHWKTLVDIPTNWGKILITYREWGSNKGKFSVKKRKILIEITPY